MENKLSDEQKERIFLDVIHRMKEFSGPFIAEICGNLGDDTGELIGTGTFIRLRDKCYLITAQHVAAALFHMDTDGSPKYEYGLSHTVGYGKRAQRIVHPWITWGSPKDLAVSRLEEVVFAGTDRTFLSADHLAMDASNLNERDVYFIHGFPGEESRYTSFANGLVSTSLPYGGFLETSTWSGFDAAIHFAISYPHDGTVDENSQPKSLPAPGGLSGSLVWKTNKAGTGQEWSPEMARIVGVVHRFDQASQCLVATRIEYLKELLLYVLRSEFAYQRWLSRGMPLWDDLDDWVAAEHSIVDLGG